jgi:hypothetical protein
MDSTALVEAKINSGRDLVHELDKTAWKPSIATWFLYGDVGEWRLLLASPTFDTMPPVEAYKRVAEALAKLAEPDLEISDIKIVKTTEPLAQVMRKMIHTGANSISQIRLTNNFINGIFVQDALAYRLS